MKISKIIARKVFFPGLVSLRIDRFLLSRSSLQCLIANFHGVTSVQGKRFNNRHLDVAEFEKIIKHLSENFKVVSLSEIFEIHRSKSKPFKKTIALTFDDGYLNNFIEALPILKKYNVPATFYLITKGLVDDSYYVWPDIIDLVQKEAKEDIMVNGNIFKYPGFFCEKLAMSLVDFLKSSGSKRDKYVNELSEKYPLYKKIVKNEPQLIELVRKSEFTKYAREPLIEYGSHTHLHYNLEHLTDEECEFELGESKKIIEGMTGKKVNSIAFPDGSYNQKTLELCLKNGFDNLVAVEYKFNEKNSKDFLLSRFTISNSTTFESNIIRLASQFKKYAF